MDDVIRGCLRTLHTMRAVSEGCTQRTRSGQDMILMSDLNDIISKMESILYGMENE